MAQAMSGTMSGSRTASVGSSPRLDRGEIARIPPRRAYSPLASALIGFVAGSVFWHFVGFWDFMSRIVFHQPRAELERSVRHGGTATPKLQERLSVGGRSASDETTSAAAPNCVTLVRDPETGVTADGPCPPDSVPQRSASAIRRGDLARLPKGEAGPSPADGPRVGGWSTVTNSAPRP